MAATSYGLTCVFIYLFIRDPSFYLVNRKSPKQQQQAQTLFHHLYINCMRASAAAKQQCIMMQIMHKELAASSRHQDITQNRHQ